MTRPLLIGTMMIYSVAVAQQPGGAASPTPDRKTAPQTTEVQTRHVQSGSGAVSVNPNQPYRPIPKNGAQSRGTIFEFYLKSLNPRQIKWDDEIDRHLGVFAQ